MNRDTLKKLFIDPPSEYRSTPYWVWNTKMTREGIHERLEDFKDKGCGGVLIHARVGLETEYLSEDWFNLWEYALEECKRLGLSCNIYDENHFPPPMAGGHTCAEAEIPYCWVEWNEETNGTVEKEAEASTWCGGFPPPNTLHPNVTKAFLHNTYEAYYKRFKNSYGKEILMSYNDEPGCRGQGGGRKGLPWSEWLREEFRKKIGRDISKELPLLFTEKPGCESTRFDYYFALQQLFEENYMKPLHDFCEKTGIAFTGHLWEERWPAPFDCPSVMSACRWYQEPGLDVLGPMYIPDDENVNALCLFMLKQVVSVANQLGRKRVSSEMFGAIGYETALDQLAPLAAFVMVHGVTRPVEHMAMQSITGSRKYDFPQTLGPQAPWWRHYKSLTDIMARSCLAGCAGKPFSRVLVLLPTTTGWIRANPENTDVLKEMQNSICCLLRKLSKAGIDFDLGNELLMADFASVTDKNLIVGEMKYEAMIIPPDTDNLCESTVSLLEKMADSKIPVYRAGKIPTFINGRPEVERLKKCIEPFTKFDKIHALLSALRNDCPPVLDFEGMEKYPNDLEHRVRVFDDGRYLLLLCNSGLKELKEKISGGNWKRMCPCTGKIKNLHNGELHLASGEICILLENSEHCKSANLSEGPLLKPKWDPVERMDPNVLQLDFCDLELGGKLHKEMYATQANLKLWKTHGFNGVPWVKIQYKDKLISKKFPVDSGFRVTYSFELSRSGKEHLENKPCKLAVERSELYKIKVNNQAVEGFDERWMDENIRTADVSNLLCEGTNYIELSVDRMLPVCEIDRVYLLGDFSLIPAEKGFLMTEPKQLTFGDWTLQGLPFYNGRIRLQGEIRTETDIHAMKTGAIWNAGVVGVSFNEGQEHAIYEGCRKINQSLKAGNHRMELIFYSTPRNMLGPHFCKTRNSHFQELSGYYSWRWYAPEQSMGGKSYNLLPFGPAGEISFKTLL